MTDLSEFLLARIAEDEAAATGASPELYLGDAGYRYDVNQYPVDQAFVDRFSAARVLAECAAKRRIVEESHVLSRHGPGRVVAPEMRWVLASLALPYADHPDFREEWRQ